MNKEKDFFKTCFNTVAGLEVKNESQAIAKEVVLSEIENLQQQNKQIKEKITDLNCYLYSGDFKSNFESINNEVYIRAKIKDIIGLSMSEEEFGILKNKYYKIDIRPSFTTRKLKKVEEQLNKIKKLIGAYDEVSSLEKEIESIIGDSNVRQ